MYGVKSLNMFLSQYFSWYIISLTYHIPISVNVVYLETIRNVVRVLETCFVIVVVWRQSISLIFQSCLPDGGGIV